MVQHKMGRCFGANSKQSLTLLDTSTPAYRNRISRQYAFYCLPWKKGICSKTLHVLCCPIKPSIVFNLLCFGVQFQMNPFFTIHVHHPGSAAERLPENQSLSTLLGWYSCWKTSREPVIIYSSGLVQLLKNFQRTSHYLLFWVGTFNTE